MNTNEVLKLALEALEWCHGGEPCGTAQAITALREALAEQPAPVQQGGLEMVDDEGENQAVRMFLALYGGQYGITAEQMRKHLKMAGFDNAWPEWANSHNGHLTKAGAQLWIRHLFALAEQPAQQEPVGEWGDGRSEAKRILWKPGYVVSAKVGDKLYTSPQPAQQEPVAPTAVEMQNAAANLALMRELWGNSDEPAAKVNDEGFIVETGLLLSPGTKLYTSPPAQRKPLTKDQVRGLLADAGYDTADLQARWDFRNGVRQCEAAHGIKENT